MSVAPPSAAMPLLPYQIKKSFGEASFRKQAVSVGAALSYTAIGADTDATPYNVQPNLLQLPEP